MPSFTPTVAVPLDKPLQLTFTELTIESRIGAGWVTVAVAVTVHPLASVTLKV